MSKATQLVAIAMQTGTPVIAWGPPGVAKSRGIEAISARLNRSIRTVVLSQMDPADVAGYPAVVEGEYRVLPPAYIRKSTAQTTTFFDELTTARPSVQGVSLRIIREQVAADDETRLEGVVVAAANPADQVAGTELIAPAANRFFHVAWPVDINFLDAWCDYMVGGEGIAADVPVLPANWRDHEPNRRAQIAGYVRHRKDPSVLHKLPSAERQGGAWPSPRTLEMAATLLAAADSIGAAHLVPDILAGCAGEAWAAECLAWLRDANLPDPAAVLDGKAKVPTRADAAYATLSAVVGLAIARDKGLPPAPTKAQCESSAHRAAWRILYDLHTAGSHPADTTALAARRLAASFIQNHQKVMETLPAQQTEPFLKIFASLRAASGATK